MEENKSPLGITDVVLRDASQSLLATRVRLDDMLPIAAKLDQVGFWSLESWGMRMVCVGSVGHIGPPHPRTTCTAPSLLALQSAR